MSKEALTKVINRSISDAMFRRQLTQDPAGATRGYDLTADEVAALRTRDTARLTAVGVDQRMSRAFTLGQAGATLSAESSSDLSIAGAVQGPDAVDRNAFQSIASNSIQAPDAIARNAFEPASASVQSPDAIARNAFEPSMDAVQSPDAWDRNLDTLVAGGSEPHDITTTDVGDASATDLGGTELQH